MIFGYFFEFLVKMISLIFKELPVVEELPWGTDETLSKGVAGYRLLMELFPIFGLFLDLTLLYLGFKIVMLFLKAILGSRLPYYA